MVYTTCVVFGCRSTSYKNKDLRFFRIPSSEERRRLWIQVCKRPDLKDKDDKTLNYKHVCSLHFEKSMYSKKNLKKSALPTLHISPPMYSKHTQTILDKEESNNVRREPVPENVNIKIEFDPEDDKMQEEQILRSEDVQPFNIKIEGDLKDELSEKSSFTRFRDHSNQTKASLSVQTSEGYSTTILADSERLRFNDRHLDPSDAVTPSQFKMACDKFLSPQMSAIVKAQVEFKQNSENPRYSHDFKLFCLNFYQSNPDAYKALRNIFNLPPEDTLSNLYISSSVH